MASITEVAVATTGSREPASTRVAQGVTRLPQGMVNCYLVGDYGAPDRGWVLVDAAMPWSEDEIVQAAEKLFGRYSRPAAIVLTHGHFDHIGHSQALAERWDAPIYAHELELPYLTGRSAYPPPDPAVGGGGMSLLSRFLPPGPFDLGRRVHALPADGRVPGMNDWRWVATRGHSPGHVSLFRDRDRCLLAGDAFVTQRQESLLGILLRIPEVCRPPAYFTPDWEAARASVETLAGLRPSVAATGHGLPMRGEELRRGLETLLAEWDDVAVPNRGRYVGRPATTNRDGIVSLPPPVFDRQLFAIAGLGLGLLVSVFAKQRPAQPGERGRGL